MSVNDHGDGVTGVVLPAVVPVEGAIVTDESGEGIVTSPFWAWIGNARRKRDKKEMRKTLAFIGPFGGWGREGL
jgi:hypothetical protein